ncbi:MAG: hypothetical protein KDK30_17690 [Leptospiraceae bacterium]|nr:hypothetical protein [Leptospiraceae bacterium]
MNSSELKTRASLFTVTGIELEYMIVDRDSLAVRPIADRFFYDLADAPVNEYENGSIAWSNELVNHVIELKCNGPAPALRDLSDRFAENIATINTRLQAYNARLMPTGAHPFMRPDTETRLWPNENNEIYELYDRIFNCRGHGWSNLQSMHINLPFADDDEFGRLHAAVRLLLPILPALSASSPLLEESWDSHHDARLRFYRTNQQRVPVITGDLIPEQVFTEGDYHRHIFDPIRAAMTPLDPLGILEYEFLNSRGAIARFDRGAIEIRVLDTQECPRMDISIALAGIAVLRWLTGHTRADMDFHAPADVTLPAAPGYAIQCDWTASDLLNIFEQIIRTGEDTIISNERFLNLFHFPAASGSARQLWRHIFTTIIHPLLKAPEQCALPVILEHGSLSTRIKRSLSAHSLQHSHIVELYRQFADCLATNRAYVPANTL